MTDGPGQQPPQEPRTNADAAGRGEREVLEGRVIPSRPQSQRDADPRRQFRQQTPEPGPAWSPQAEAADQSAPHPEPGRPWSAQDPPQAALTQPTQDPATQVIPAQQPPYAGQQPAAQQYAGQQPVQQPDAGRQPPQAYAAGPQPGSPQYAPPQPQAEPYPPQTPPAPGHPAQQPQPYPGGPGHQQAYVPGPAHPQAQPQPGQAPQQPPAAAGPAQPQGHQQAHVPGPAHPQAQPQPGQAPQQPPARQAPQRPAAQGGPHRQPAAGAGQVPQPGPAQPQGRQGAGQPRAGGPHVPFGGGAAPRPAPRATSPEPEPSTPDWGALAEQQEATGARRRRVLMLTGGIVAVAVIAGGVATAVVMSGKSDDKPAAGPSSSGSTTASQPTLPPLPSFSSVAPPPPANPLDYLNSAAKDKAPLTPDSLFPGKQFVWQGRTYVKTKADVTASCAKNARKGLATALTANGCQKLIRATFTQGGLAVTVGVAVFPDDTHAKKVAGVSQYLAPLNGGGVADFCHAVRCQMTSNAVGRYAYFAISGFKNGTTLAANDKVGRQAADDASDFAFTRIVQRGKDAAAADPSRQQ